MILAVVLGMDPIETKTAVERAARRLLQKRQITGNDGSGSNGTGWAEPSGGIPEKF